MKKRLVHPPTFVSRSLHSKIILCFFGIALVFGIEASAQVVPLGTVDEFYKGLKKTGSGNQRRGVSSVGAIDRILPLKINVDQLQGSNRLIIGGVPDVKASTIYFKFSGANVEGKAILLSEKKAYEYFSENGNVFVKEVDIDKVVCVEYAKAASSPAVNVIQAIPPASSQVYHLQSFSSAKAVIKLDFDGEYVANSEWNGGLPIDAQPYNYTETEITQIWQYVAEDFSAFDVNVTTDEAVYLAAPARTRQRVIFTTTTTASPNDGGVAHFNSFVKGTDDPCWVFNTGVKAAGETASHEAGHTLGLFHDGKDAPGQPHVEYYGGQGIWAPIMGVGFGSSSTLVQWSKGEYSYANNTENDVEVIGGGSNGFTYRKDEAGATAATANQLVYTASGTVTAANNPGIISHRDDVDAYYFTTIGGSATLTVNPSSPQPNLDVLLVLKSSAGTIVATANPAATLGATITATLTAGKYYLSVDGTGSGDPVSTGYSDFSSLGGYTISGSFPASTYNPAPVVAFTFPKPLDTLVTGASVSLTATATDNGSVAKVDFYEDDVLLLSDNAAPYSILYTPASGNHYLRVVATDNLGASTTAFTTVFSRRSDVIATVYQNCDYDPSGYAVKLYEGSWRLSQLEKLGVRNDDISSLKVIAGYEVVLFRDESFVGPSYSYSSNISCLAADNLNDWASSLIVRKVNNTIPVVTITAPSNGQRFDTGTNIVFAATASDPDGTIVKVDFYNGTTLLYSDIAAPFAYTIPNAASGNYNLKATAFDNSGNSVSATSNITVSLPPTVAGINGPLCVSPGQIYPYILNPGSGTPTGVNWWASSGNIQVDAVNRNKANFTAVAGSGTVVIHAGVNYSTAPWYQEFQITVSQGSCGSAAENSNKAPFIVFQNPFSDETLLLAGPDDQINSIKIFDAKGMEIQKHRDINKESVLLGKELLPGIYILHVETNKTVFKKTLIKQ